MLNTIVVTFHNVSSSIVVIVNNKNLVIATIFNDFKVFRIILGALCKSKLVSALL